MCNRLGTIPASDGQTDGHLATAYTRYAYASRSKNLGGALVSGTLSCGPGSGAPFYKKCLLLFKTGAIW